MTWANIPGRAAYLWIYDEFLKTAPLGATVAEVGVALGKSVAYLCEEALRLGRNDIKVYAVDSWEGTARNGEQQAMSPGGDSDWLLFLDMMRANSPEALKMVRPIRMPSLQAWRCFQTNAVDLVVLDAAHDYENVRADIACWLGTLKKGGSIGGDDYVGEYPGVIQAVKERFKEDQYSIGSYDGWGTWLARGVG